MSSGAAAEHHTEEHPPAVVWSSKTPTGLLGMFFFIGSEIALFCSFFMAYFFIRLGGVSDYNQWAEAFGNQVPVGVATMNSLILFSSSVTIHYAGIALKRDARKWIPIWVGATLVLGLTFLSIQLMEYSSLAVEEFAPTVHHALHGAETITPKTNAFSSVFFSLTGLHGSHVLVGAILLAILLVRSLRGHYGPKPEQHTGWEAMSVYWHFVDLVWVFVFGLIYLPGNFSRLGEDVGGTGIPGTVMLIGGIAVLAVLFFLPNFIGKGAPKHEKA